jgi:hypothetical protein
MPTSQVARLIARIPVRPLPLFQDDVDSADSHDDDAAAVEEMLATQGPKDSGEVKNLAPSFGLMDREGYVDMRKPWVEGPRSEKVCRSGVSLGKLADLVVVYSASDGLPPHHPTALSRLVYKGSMACVSEQRCPNTANPEDLCVKGIRSWQRGSD